MKLVLVGTGYVGLVSGSCFAEFGYEVICVDSDESRIFRIKGKCPFFEPGMEELLSKHGIKPNYLVLQLLCLKLWKVLTLYLLL